MHRLAPLAIITTLAACGDDPATSDVVDTSVAPDTTVTTDTDEPDTTVAETVADTIEDVADAADVADVRQVTVGACSSASPEGLAGCVEQARYSADLATLAAAPRPTWSPGWETARDLCATRLEEYGYTVELADYGSGTNVVGVLPGKTQPTQFVMLGAHYDGAEACAGADDNATGVAGMLEAARVLALGEHDRTLMVACWDEEERGLIGSQVLAMRMSRIGAKIAANFTFEMIGYYDDAPDTQVFPDGFSLIFADAYAAVSGNQFRGDFIAYIGGDDASPALEALTTYARAVDMPSVTLKLSAALRSAAALGDLRRSDHAPFWIQGYPAVQITDTANFRYDGYHCFITPDAIDRLDPVRASKVVQATVGAAAEALREGPAEGVPSGRPAACDVVAQDCTEGKRCTIVSTDFDTIESGCTDPRTPAVAFGETCERRADGAVGYDNCAVGQACVFFGKPQADPQERRCLRLCNVTADCQADEQCATWHPAVNDGGLCMPSCDLFDAESCGEGLSCSYRFKSTDDGSFVPGCDWVGTAQEGDACESLCDAGLACVAEDDGARRCRVLCDSEHACNSGTCTPYRNTGARTTLGTCLP